MIDRSRYYSYKYFAIKLQNDPDCINELYEELISVGPESFPSFEEYGKTILLFTKLYVSYNDYLHSNNLLQMYRVYSTSLGELVDSCDWYQYYSIKIYSKRSIKYYLDNPSIFWETVYRLLEMKGSPYLERLDNLLVDTLEFYKSEYVSFPEFLNASLTKFVNYYFSNKNYSTTIDSHIGELRKLIISKDPKKVADAYAKLPSQNIEEIEIPSTLKLGPKELKIIQEREAREKEKEENLFGDIRLDDEDSNKKILIVGDDPFLHKQNVIYGIAKDFNIQKGQLEIYNDYDRIKQEGARIVDKTQYNTSKYIGIIFGSSPHSTTANEGASSLISKVQSMPGYPYSVVCRQNNSGGKPKITKTSLKTALRQIIINYNTNGDPDPQNEKIE